MAHGLDPYPSPEAREAEFRALTEAAGGEVRTYGTSVEGRPLQVARLPQRGRADSQKARVLVTANIHGIEWVSSRVALGVLGRVDATDALRRLRSRAEIWVVPCANPDGYARTHACIGHDTLTRLRTNARGVDLNRNFPLPIGGTRRPLPGAGSSRPGHANYAGPHPLSEPETASIAALLSEQTFVASVNVHSFAGAFIPARTKRRRDFDIYCKLARIARAPQPNVPYWRLSSRFIDTYTGELEDYQHHKHNVWAVCLETFSWRASWRQHFPGFAPSWFWRFNPRNPEPWVDNDVPAVAAFLNAALDLATAAGAREQRAHARAMRAPWP